MLGTDPRSSRKANSALTMEPSLQPGYSVSISPEQVRAEPGCADSRPNPVHMLSLDFLHF